MRDALFVLEQTLGGEAGSPVMRQSQRFVATAPRVPVGYTGRYTVVTVAAAPFPVPITYKGTFRMMRLGAEPEPAGWLARLLAMFKGCGG